MSKNPLAKSSWRLIEFLTGDASTPPIDGTELTAIFTEDALSGSGGCNQFNAKYLIKEPNQISIFDLASTKKFCEQPPGIMKQEEEYFQRLKGANQFFLGGSGPLDLVSEQTELGLRFERL
ncbi:MAG: META domain-containing protein [Acidobacteriota bacterium]